jgi:hypothetical protein
MHACLHWPSWIINWRWLIDFSGAWVCLRAYRMCISTNPPVYTTTVNIHTRKNIMFEATRTQWQRKIGMTYYMSMFIQVKLKHWCFRKSARKNSKDFSRLGTCILLICQPGSSYSRILVCMVNKIRSNVVIFYSYYPCFHKNQTTTYKGSIVLQINLIRIITIDNVQ